MIIEKMITGISNLNKFYDQLDQSKIIDFSQYCDHRDDDQEKNEYVVQIKFNPRKQWQYHLKLIKTMIFMN